MERTQELMKRRWQGREISICPTGQTAELKYLFSNSLFFAISWSTCVNSSQCRYGYMSGLLALVGAKERAKTYLRSR